jgi:AbrB family looped-hinge helix DNA binding protein
MARSPEFVRSLTIGPQGRIVIPADVRRALALGEGESVVAWVEGGRLVIQSRRAVEEELWSMFEGVERSLSGDLLRERRDEAAREEATRKSQDRP